MVRKTIDVQVQWAYSIIYYYGFIYETDGNNLIFQSGFFSQNIPICIWYFSSNYIATTSVRKMNEYDQKFLYSLTALLYQKALIKTNGLIQETSDM